MEKNRYICVCNPLMSISEIKSKLLLFDSICLCETSNEAHINLHSIIEEEFKEYELLRKYGLLQTMEDLFEKKDFQNMISDPTVLEKAKKFQLERQKIFTENNKLKAKIQDAIALDNKGKTQKQIELEFITRPIFYDFQQRHGDLYSASKNLEYATLRLNSSYLNSLFEIEAVPGFSDTDNPFIKNDKGQKVIRIILKEFPTISIDNRVEDIIDFKMDSNNRELFLGLKVWFNNFQGKDVNLRQFEDELEYNLLRYERAMKKSKLKTEKGIAQAIIIPTIEFIENTFKLEFSKIIKGLFEIDKEQQELHDFENQEPWSKIAYIYKVKEKFKN